MGGVRSTIKSRVLAKSFLPRSWEPRGSACCVFLNMRMKRRLVGIGHYRLNTFNYISFAYAMDELTYDIVKISSPFCLALPHDDHAHFDQPSIPECPYIQLVYSMNAFNETHALMGVGSNDCQANLLYVPLTSILRWFV